MIYIYIYIKQNKKSAKIKKVFHCVYCVNIKQSRMTALLILPLAYII